PRSSEPSSRSDWSGTARNRHLAVLAGHGVLSANTSASVRLASGTFAFVVPAQIAVQSIGIDESGIWLRLPGSRPVSPEFAIGELAIGLLGIGEFGIGLLGIGEVGIGAAPTAEFGIGLFGIGALAYKPSSGPGTELSGTFAAPAGAVASSEVSDMPASDPVAVTHGENSDVLPLESVAVAVIDSPTVTG